MEYTRLTGELSQVEQYCPDWAKEVMRLILQMPTVQAAYSAEDIIYLLKKEQNYLEIHKPLTDRMGNPMFGGHELRVLQLKLEKQLLLSQKRQKDERKRGLGKLP